MHLDKNLRSWLNLLGGFVSLWTNDPLHFVFHLQGRKVGTSLCTKNKKNKLLPAPLSNWHAMKGALMQREMACRLSRMTRLQLSEGQKRKTL